ncbi:MAG: hypothetical protein OXU79_02085 [Gemmatimonadota bacterium]|nr:hypothetical protein [Gemmatimonadota bacterium]
MGTLVLDSFTVIPTFVKAPTARIEEKDTTALDDDTMVEDPVQRAGQDLHAVEKTVDHHLLIMSEIVETFQEDGTGFYAEISRLTSTDDLIANLEESEPKLFNGLEEICREQEIIEQDVARSPDPYNRKILDEYIKVAGKYKEYLNLFQDYKWNLMIYQARHEHYAGEDKGSTNATDSRKPSKDSDTT